MTKTIASGDPINQLRMLVPMPRSQPDYFSRWLKEVLALRPFSPKILAEKAGMSPQELNAVISNSSGSTRGLRRDTYEAVMYLLDKYKPTPGTTPMFTAKQDISVYFTGRDGEHEGQCLRILEDAIRSAKRRIRVMAYVVTAQSFLMALEKAAHGGIDVRVIYDPKVRRPSKNWQFIQFIPDTIHYKAHNKIIIIDDETVFTGSFNFTNGADDKNAENLLEIRDPKVIKEYATYWDNTCGSLKRSAASREKRRI